MTGPAPDAVSRFHYAWRGWILGALFTCLALARWRANVSLWPLWPPGLGLVALGAAFRLYAGVFIPGHSNLLRLSGDVLASRGPYRYSRHPLYLSNLAVIAGLILFAHCLPWWAALLLFAIALAHHGALARAEERFLAAARGNAYRVYLEVTPRWLGRPGKAPAGLPQAPQTREASRGPTGPVPEGASLPIPGGLAPLRLWRRQGPNLGKTLLCVLILRMLAGHPWLP